MVGGLVLGLGRVVVRREGTCLGVQSRRIGEYGGRRLIRYMFRLPFP